MNTDVRVPVRVYTAADDWRKGRLADTAANLGQYIACILYPHFGTNTNQKPSFPPWLPAMLRGRRNERRPRSRKGWLDRMP